MSGEQSGIGTATRPWSLHRRAAIRTAMTAATAAFVGRSGHSVIAQGQTASPVADAPLRIRQNAKELTDEQKRNFVNAVLALKQKPSPWLPSLSTYDTFVLWHRDAFMCSLESAHMGPAFFPWHRQFLLMFEEQLQSVDPSVNLPYWDWTVDTETDSYLWQPDLMGGDGSDDDNEAVIDGPFAKGNWEIAVFDHSDPHRLPWITRDLGMGGLAPDLPTPEELEATLSMPTYDTAPWSAESLASESFRNALEGWRDCVVDMCGPVDGAGTTCTGEHAMHNRVHLWVSGEWAFAHEIGMVGGSHDTEATTMADGDEDMVLGTMAANSSPNDPVFFLHHTNIDRLWDVWMRRHGQQYLPETGGPVGHNIDDPMWPYWHLGMTITPRMMLESAALGYAYDVED